jgi:6-phospho-beta-glucosidase
MSTPLRIAIIGGGSAYMPGLAYSFAAEASRFGPATLVLHDIDPDALDVQRRLTAGILRANGGESMAVESTDDLDTAVDGATFVLTTFRPGGLQARHFDESIPPKYGVIGQETTGPGGLAMALRSVPAVLEVTAAMRRSAQPDAVLLNYTNPVQIVTDALLRHGGVQAIGLCDQHRGEATFIAELLGLDREDIEGDTWGTNHVTWTRAIRHRGQDITDLVFDRLAELDPASVDDYWRPVPRLFPLYGLIPSRYLKYFAMHHEALEDDARAGKTRAEQILDQLGPIVESYRAEADSDDPHPAGGRFSPEHGDFAVRIIAAILSGEPTRFILNVENQGAIDGLPDDAAVELPCIVHGREIERVPMGPMPDQVAGLVLQMAKHARLASDAAVSGDRVVALQALMAHPLVNDLPSAEAMLDELLEAHRAHLPQFALV